ncbi:MAG: DUF4831 family protein [Muribaculaceae bacterium]|nr:DUF4831 family protein [Muribaculaceae bacterium]
MKKSIILLAWFSIFLNIGAQQTKLLTAEKHNEYGLVYTLPVTAFQVEVVAVKEVQIAGHFSKYSKLFTADSKVISQDAVNWSIESVKVIPYGIPDAENRYLMQLKAGSTTFIGVADDGMLLSINKETELSFPEALNVTTIEGTQTTGKEYLEFVNEDFTSAQSSYKQAQILAEELQEIREAKLSLTRGTAETMPTDGRQLEIMLSSLDQQEKALMNAFTGSSWKERVVRSFTFVPEKEGKSVLCRFSLTDGIVEADDYSGEPVYVSVKVVEEAQLPVDSKGDEKKIPKDAVIYCIPGTADLSLNYMGTPLFNKSYQMSQFGMTFGLSPSIFTDKKEPSYAIFDPSTGALKELGTLKQ